MDMVNVNGIGFDAVVAVVRAVRPGTVRFPVIGSVAVIRVCPCAPGNNFTPIESCVIGGVDVFAVLVRFRHVLCENDSKSIAGGKVDRVIQFNGVIAGESEAPGL